MIYYPVGTSSALNMSILILPFMSMNQEYSYPKIHVLLEYINK
jgi:hypothetical protein